MKKLVFAIFMTISILTFAQEEKVYHNEFGIDATSFVKQFLNFSTVDYPDYYEPTYYLTYRRLFSCGNIRFAVGGSLSDHDIPASWEEDSNHYHYHAYSLDARIGWEFYSELGKRWQAFYGLDFRPSLFYEKSDVNYWNAGYANGNETEIQTYSAAPLLGFRFYINDRLSLSTEASFSFDWQVSKDRDYYIPETNAYPPKPDDVTPKSQSFNTNFYQPISLFMTFNI